jgi:orotate phosphoribosyltransferase
VSESKKLDGYASDVAGARDVLVRELRRHSLVIGDVTLASGARASYYVDARRAILRPECFLALGRLIAHHAQSWRASAVGGVPISAIPVACASLAAAAGGLGDLAGGEACVQKAFIVRKERKEHGLGRLVEGPVLDPGERCVVVEDVVTSGGSTIELLERLAGEDVVIAGVISVLDRLAGGADAIRAATDAPYVALTTIDDLYPDRPDR